MTKKEFESLVSFNYETKGLNDRILFSEDNIKYINFELIKLIDDINIYFTKIYGISTKIHTIYEKTGHSKNSYHYKGLACDFSFSPNYKYNFTSQINYLVNYLKKYSYYNRVGIGIYYEWINRGFHIDLRGKNLSWFQECGIYFYKPINDILKYLKNKGY
jgi:hypothetical protein